MTLNVCSTSDVTWSNYAAYKLWAKPKNTWELLTIYWDFSRIQTCANSSHQTDGPNCIKFEENRVAPDAILWYRCVASLWHEDGSKTSAVEDRGQISHFYPFKNYERIGGECWVRGSSWPYRPNMWFWLAANNLPPNYSKFSKFSLVLRCCDIDL